MLYYLLQPASEEEDEDLPQPDLPDKVNKIVRTSLSLEQNEVLNLAARLAGNLDKETGAGVGSEAGSAKAERNDRMRKKVRTIARMARMFKTLRQENEAVIRLKGVCPGHRLPAGVLLAGKSGLSTEIDRFDNAKNVDLMNEKRPENEEGG